MKILHTRLVFYVVLVAIVEIIRDQNSRKLEFINCNGRSNKYRPQWDNSIQQSIRATIRNQKLKRRLNHWKSHKQLNKEQHSSEGNRAINKLKIGFWNNKISQGQRMSTTRDSVGLTLRKRNIDVLCLSESNVRKDEDSSDIDIDGYNLINDKLHERLTLSFFIF